MITGDPVGRGNGCGQRNRRIHPTTTMALRYRKHIRLPDHDYLQGAYFVTLCTRFRRQAFGRIEGSGAAARMELTAVGRIVDACWQAIPNHFPHTRLHELQIMPDHLHAIIELQRMAGATPWVAATDEANGSVPIATETINNRRNGPRRGSLSAIIGAFKSETTKRMNRLDGTTGHRLWQPNFHERIIRERYGEFGRIAHYIIDNPAQWQ